MKTLSGTSTPMLITLTAFLLISCTKYQIPDMGLDGPASESPDPEG